MREQLTQYVELLFVGTSGTDEIRQEILQNSLDRFDDLVAQGKTPEAAYRLTLSGIGDINEILDQQPADPPAAPAQQPESEHQATNNKSQTLRALAIALYILSAIPVIFLEEIGLFFTLMMVAAATGILVYIGKDDAEKNDDKAVKSEETGAKSEDTAVPVGHTKGRKLAKTIITLVGLAIYLSVSFATHAWLITWLIFPMMACVKGIVRGIFDLMEACEK